MDVLGIGGFEIVVLLGIALAVVSVVGGLHLVVRAAIASGVRQADGGARPGRGERRD